MTVATKIGLTDRWPAADASRVVPLASIAFLAINGAFLIEVGDVFTQLVIVNVLLAFGAWPMLDRSLLKIRPTDVALGLVAAAAMYGASVLLMRVGPIGGQMQGLFLFSAGHSKLFLLLMLPPVVIAEELIWRGVVTRLLADRMPLWVAALAGAIPYAMAHAGSGFWLLPVTALAAGWAWAGLFALTRRLWAGMLCHLVWDILIFVVN